jgi:hypothetical protein
MRLAGWSGRRARTSAKGSRLSASGHERRLRPVAVVPITDFVDTSRSDNTAYALWPAAGSADTELRCHDETGGGSWIGGNLRASSIMRSPSRTTNYNSCDLPFP